MMLGLRVTEEELRALLVTRLEVLGEVEFEKARKMAARLAIPIERALADQCRIPLEFILKQLADSWGVDFVDLKVGDVKLDALRAVPVEMARTHMVMPFERTGMTLRVAMCDPRDRKVQEDIQRRAGLQVVPCLTPEMAIRRAHLLYNEELRGMLERSTVDEVASVLRARRAGEEERSAVDLVNRMLEFAVVTGASDIHIEPFELEGLVRCRIDGVLRDVLSLPRPLLAPVVARVKILATMRIDEHRAPQDGRIDMDLGGFKADLRASALPTQWGEKLVLRVLSKEASVIDLEGLGLDPTGYQIVLRNLLRPFGMLLITGPTGSGKSTTLYAMLQRLAAERQNMVNISTIEDPVESTIPRVNQIPINLPAGLDFAAGLRALLRQDPDVIMVGEIRDRETAELGVRAALLGRLLLSTLHTNDATAAVPRLLDMGIESFLLASTLSLVVGQRLVRRICTSCRESLTPEESVLRALQARPDFEATMRVLGDQGVLSKGADPLSTLRLFRGKGCQQCSGTGFKGRLGVFELFEIDEQVRGMIMERRDAASIRAAAVSRGMKTMFQDGLAKVFLGETTLEEVFRVAL
jgi:type IV pilus assembly protein PilB